MCEANAYMQRGDRQELILESVDVVEPRDDGSFLLVDIFGTQKIVNARLRRMQLVEHKMIFAE